MTTGPHTAPAAQQTAQAQPQAGRRSPRNPLQNTTIRVRLFALGGLLTALLLVVALVSINGFIKIRGAYREANVPEQARATMISAYEGWLTADDQTNMYSALAELHDQRQLSLMNATWQQVEQGRAQAAANIRALTASSLPAGDLALVHRLAADTPVYNGYSTQMHELVVKVFSGQVTASQVPATLAKANSYVTVQNANISNAIQGVYNKLHADLQSQEQQAKGQIPDTVSATLAQAGVIGGVSLLLAVIVTLLIIRSITRPLRKVEEAAERFEQGAVDIDLDVREKSEIGRVAQSFRAAIQSQKRLSQATGELAAGNLGVAIKTRSPEDVLSNSIIELQTAMRESLGEHASTLRLHRGLKELLKTLEDLDTGLMAMFNGDLTVEISSQLTPITAQQEGEPLGFVADSYNEMIRFAEASIGRYDQMRQMFRQRLGDHTCMDALTERMHKLSDHCLAGLLRGLNACAAGDLTVEVSPMTRPIPASDGEDLGELADVFNTMLNQVQGSLDGYNNMRLRIAEMIQEISRSSQTVSSTSVQMVSNSEDTERAISEIADAVVSVAHGAEEQVRSVQAARRSTEELAEVSRRSAEVALETADVAEQARALAREGVSAAENASEAMLELRDSSESTSSAIQSLGEKSDQIGGIVETITALAEQTNLLALNAAIEAARAGDHGRGFAVVAEEVRQLAEESQTAAGTIGHLIQEIQRETTNAITIVHHSGERTHNGVATVEQTRDAFLQIGTSVEDVSNRVEQIAAAIREIAASGQEMQATMDTIATIAESSSAASQQVSAGAEQTSAVSEEVAASAQELAKTASELDALVGQFTLV